MAKSIVDTSILVDMFRGHLEAAKFIGDALTAREAYAHPLVVAEVLVGSRNRREMQHFHRTLEALEPVAVEATDWDSCLKLFRTHFLSHGIGWEDCLIAATALRLGYAVATLNDKHFSAIPGLAVIRPY